MVALKNNLRWAFWISLVVLIGLWQWVVKAGIISEIILAAPSDVIVTFWSICLDVIRGGAMFGHLWITLMEVLVGFLLSIIIGVTLGVLVAESRLMEAIISPYVVALNASPKIAFVPIIVTWLGFGAGSKIAIAAFIAFFPVFVNVVAGMRSVEEGHLEMMRALLASRWKILLRLKVPHALPYFFAGLRTGIVLSVIGAIVGEFSGASKGLGAYIKMTSNELRVSEVFAAILVLSLVGIALYEIIGRLERRFVFWL